MLPVDIEYLADRPEWLPVLAEWFYQEWGHGDPPFSIEDFLNQFHTRLNRDRFPLTMVASLKGVPIATASLKLMEMETHPQYLHWLGGVFSLPQYRRKGIGARVVEATATEARRLGISELYLYTRRSVALYAELGWEIIEQPEYRGHPVSIMKRRLDKF